MKKSKVNIVQSDNKITIMKKYKRTYCASLPWFFLKLIVICAPCVLIGDIVLFFLDKSELCAVLVSFIFVSLLLMVFGWGFMTFVSLIINLFKNASVSVNERFITHMNKELDLDKIEYITLFLPEFKSRTSSSPQELSLYINAEEHIVIRRPSIRLIAYLKKRCPNAKFEIDELKSRLKTDLITGGCVTIAVFAVCLFTLWKQ